MDVSYVPTPTFGKKKSEAFSTKRYNATSTNKTSKNDTVMAGPSSAVVVSKLHVVLTSHF